MSTGNKQRESQDSRRITNGSSFTITSFAKPYIAKILYPETRTELYIDKKGAYILLIFRLYVYLSTGSYNHSRGRFYE